MKYRDHTAYQQMLAGARDPATLTRYLTESRGMYEAFRRGWLGIEPLRMYPRGSISAACCFAGRDAQAARR